MIQYLTDNINHNGLEITHICKPGLKNSYISVGEGGVVLKTPKVSKLYINDLLSKKETWIRKKLKELQKKVYVNKTILNEKEVKEYLISKVEYYSKLMGLEFSELKFRKMKRRWGSCSSLGVITLNTYLINTPEPQINYVVVHELAHLVHMDHSKKFHTLVEKYLSDEEKNFSKKQFYVL